MAWNALWTILGVMLVFLALGVPISYSIGISSLAAILATVSADAAVVTAAQRIFVGMSRFSLTAIPFFILAGNLMNQGGIAGRLVDLVLAVLGRLPGSLLVANVGANALFGAISGSASAAAAAVGSMVRDGEVGPIMLGRDHHDVSGTDSPFRETSNIYDGSNVMADMAVQCFAGNAARGMSLVALHNGGGVGIGKAVNGGFGMVLDGSERVDEILRSAMLWDVMGGVARRSWARNPNAMSTSAAFNESYGDWYHITLPFIPKEDLIQNSIRTSLKRKV